MAAGGSKCCADYSKRSLVVGGTVTPEVILSIINATAVKCNKRPMAKKIKAANDRIRGRVKYDPPGFV